MERISVTHFSDPGCPWAYSGLPAVSALKWRYANQLQWRTVTIGIAEDASRYERDGYTPEYMVAGLRFKRLGMPFAYSPRPRMMGTGLACRAIVAARLDDPGTAYLALRALHLAWFTTQLIMDEDEGIVAALSREPRLDPNRIVARLGHDDVEEAYQADRAEARSAAGSAASLQGKTSWTDGPERFTAPTLVFEHGGRRFVSGGHQPVEAHDVLVANLLPGPAREPVPDSPAPLLERFEHGLTTREVSTMLADVNDEPDDQAAKEALVELAARGGAVREPAGDDGLWLSPAAARTRPT